MLLKTNRPPTDEERAAVLESMVPVNAELKTLESQIFAAVAQVNVLQAQLKTSEKRAVAPTQEGSIGLGDPFRSTWNAFIF